ncbi:MAG: 50S ribosomal protein L28 [Firmicutes bacterium]|jgi:large subunit ribosomal protein L28|nr:50S ribosomal protein L28 [Bacillota bacterium]
MAYRCEVCGKHTIHGNNVSHSHHKTKRVWKPNIQHVRARVNGKVQRIYVCTGCLRSGRVDRAI